jgi:hypothetical protein
VRRSDEPYSDEEIDPDMFSDEEEYQLYCDNMARLADLKAEESCNNLDNSQPEGANLFYILQFSV